MKRYNIVVLGAGESGTGAAVLAKKKGHRVFVSDFAPIKQQYKNVLLHHEIDFEKGRHSEESILRADEIIKSPGIPDQVPIIREAVRKRVPVISEIEFAGRFTNAKMICITGSNGKTTTTLLTHHILQHAGLNAGLAGNVGNSLAWQVAEYDYNYYVLELSSFQLDGMVNFKADIAVLLNITPDHLDRYENDFSKYKQSKFRILQNQTSADSFIFCNDDETIVSYMQQLQIPSVKYPFSIREKVTGDGAYLENNELVITINSNKFNMTLEELALQGKHNAYNSMAAGITARRLDIRKDTIKECLSNFQHIEHRLEFIASIHGIKFINDSKATNVNSTWYALESSDNKVIWIAGGIDKGNDYSVLAEMVRKKVRAIVCLGKDNKKIKKAFADDVETIVETKSAREAVKLAYQIAKRGEIVLLSPACASFDLFENYEDRGRQFKEAVNNL